MDPGPKALPPELWTPGPLGTITGPASWVALQLSETGETLAHCLLWRVWVAALSKGPMMKMFGVGTT